MPATPRAAGAGAWHTPLHCLWDSSFAYQEKHGLQHPLAALGGPSGPLSLTPSRTIPGPRAPPARCKATLARQSACWCSLSIRGGPG